MKRLKVFATDRWIDRPKTIHPQTFNSRGIIFLNSMTNKQRNRKVKGNILHTFTQHPTQTCSGLVDTHALNTICEISSFTEYHMNKSMQGFLMESSERTYYFFLIFLRSPWCTWIILHICCNEQNERLQNCKFNADENLTIQDHENGLKEWM